MNGVNLNGYAQSRLNAVYLNTYALRLLHAMYLNSYKCALLYRARHSWLLLPQMAYLYLGRDPFVRET